MGRGRKESIVAKRELFVNSLMVLCDIFTVLECSVIVDNGLVAMLTTFDDYVFVFKLHEMHAHAHILAHTHTHTYTLPNPSQSAKGLEVEEEGYLMREERKTFSASLLLLSRKPG